MQNKVLNKFDTEKNEEIGHRSLEMADIAESVGEESILISTRHTETNI